MGLGGGVRVRGWGSCFSLCGLYMTKGCVFASRQRNLSGSVWWTRWFSSRMSTGDSSVWNNCRLLRRRRRWKVKILETDVMPRSRGSVHLDADAALTYGRLISPAHNIDWVKALTPNKSVAGVASLQGGQLLAWAGNFLMDCRKSRLVHWHASAAPLNSIILSLELNYHLLVEADASACLPPVAAYVRVRPASTQSIATRRER